MTEKEKRFLKSLDYTQEGMPVGDPFFESEEERVQIMHSLRRQGLIKLNEVHFADRGGWTDTHVVEINGADLTQAGKRVVKTL